MGCPVTKGRAQLMHHFALGREREALVGDGRASDIAAKMLKPRSVPAIDSDGRMQAEALQVRTQLLHHNRAAREACRWNAQAFDGYSRLGGQRSAALDRRGTEEMQEPLLLSELTHVQLTLFTQKPPAPAKAQDPRPS
jgi:hypothetical protein